MKYLILSCDTGEGHNSAAKAVFDRLCKDGHTCIYKNSLSFAGEKVSDKISKCYSAITVRTPRTFRFLYHAGKTISSSKHKSPIYWLNRIYADQLYQYIQQEQFDAVITSHLFAAQTLTAIEKKYNLDIPTVAIATDYTCIPFWEETALSYYVIPHADLIAEFSKEGIPTQKLVPLGIPIRDEFSQRIARSDAVRQLGLNMDKHHYLIMSGSMGYGNLAEIIHELIKQDTQSELVVICGNNQKLLDSLKQQYPSPLVHLLGFTDQIPLYMDACDVIFTKPGGLSSTEAATKQIPLIHTTPIPGCETCNVSFFSSRGMSYYNEDITQSVAFAVSLFSNEQTRASMIQAQRRYISADACKQICRFVEGL